MRTTRHARLLVFPLLLSLAACSKGPDREALKTDLQAKLDSDFKQGLFAVSEFSRNGHYGFSAEDGSDRLLIYFKARLELKENYTFSDWEQLNLSALTTVLGASSEGIKGVKHDGNASGDAVRVMGTLTYAPEGDGWALSGLSPEGEAGARAAGMDEATPFEKDLAGLAKRFKKLENRKKTAHVDVIEAEVAEALRDIGLRLDGLDGTVTLVTGVDGGEYHALGAGLQKVASAAKRPFGHYGSAGSVENCTLVGAGLADFAIVQADVAAHAAKGEGQFVGHALPGLRAVCALYPEAIQVVTLRSSGITSIDQLAGKKVGLGPAGSGSRDNATRVLKAYGVSLDSLAQASSLGLHAAAKALASGELDALFVTTAAPVRALQELAAEHPLSFLPISEAPAEALNQTGQLTPMTLHANTYPGLDADVATLGVTAQVVTREQTPAERVEALFVLLYEHSDELAQHSALAGAVNRKTARAGLSLELHPAAAERLPEE